jgi:hypothetical protein
MGRKNLESNMEPSTPIRCLILSSIEFFILLNETPCHTLVPIKIVSCGECKFLSKNFEHEWITTPSVVSRCLHKPIKHVLPLDVDDRLDVTNNFNQILLQVHHFKDILVSHWGLVQGRSFDFRLHSTHCSL